EALLIAVLIAERPAEALHKLAFNDDRPARRAVRACRTVADHGIPDALARLRLQRVDVRIAGCHINFIVVDGQTALRGAARRGANAVLPKQDAWLRVQR